jgi:hypothetical protein
MIYREPGFLTPAHSRQQVISLSHSSYYVSTVELTDGRGGGASVGGGAKSYDGKKAWSSINHSILSVHT